MAVVIIHFIIKNKYKYKIRRTLVSHLDVLFCRLIVLKRGKWLFFALQIKASIAKLLHLRAYTKANCELRN